MYSFLIAAIKDESHYDFFTYKGKKPVMVEYRHIPYKVEKGDVFGVRRSHTGKDIRMIFRGQPSRVFTLTVKQAQDLADGVRK